MTDEKDRRIAELEATVARLKEEVRTKSAVASRALASYQQRALHMEIIRQQNEDLDKLAQDLARAKKAEEARAQEVATAYRLKSEFLANFSHEIRTPLNAIIGYCDLVTREEGSRLTPHGRRDLSTIKSNARTLLALINDILDLSKIEAGHMDVIREPINTEELVEDCISTVREQLKGKDVELCAYIAEEAKSAFSDPLKLRQIILNLLSNAVKFTEVGEVGVYLDARDSTLIVRVVDTGIGIPEDQLAHVFDKFRQVDGSSRRKYGGTGLGLAIVSEITKLLGGKVELKSTLGRGSVFTIDLPESLPKESAPNSQSSQHSQPEDSTATAQSRVLIIDDDPMVLQLLAGELTRDGFEVITASDGLSGIQKAREQIPSAIVLDILLPNLDGWSVLSALKSEPATASVPVILLSVEEQRARGFALGAYEYLVKPVEPDRLAQVVRRAVAPGAGDVLIVDDDEEMRQMVRRRLRDDGFNAIEASSGEAALQELQKSSPSLIILDLVMPGMDGFAVLQRVRERGMTMPIVILTGKELTHQEKLDLQQGMVYIVRKNGVSIESVIQEARRAVSRRRTIEQQRLPRVLYVEDIAQNRDLVRRFLEGVVHLSSCDDGESALQEIPKQKPDLILMDLSLPRMDGWEVTRQLKKIPAVAGIPVIALSAHAGRDEILRAREAGCVDYLTKPVDRNVLIKTMHRYLPERH